MTRALAGSDDLVSRSWLASTRGLDSLAELVEGRAARIATANSTIVAGKVSGTTVCESSFAIGFEIVSEIEFDSSFCASTDVLRQLLSYRTK